MVAAPFSPPARDAPAPSPPGFPRSPYRGAKEDEGGPSDDVSAADSWSIRSEYGSTLDGGDDPRAMDGLDAGHHDNNGHHG